jgi:hypothetical protein
VCNKWFSGKATLFKPALTMNLPFTKAFRLKDSFIGCKSTVSTTPNKWIVAISNAILHFKKIYVTYNIAFQHHTFKLFMISKCGFSDFEMFFGMTWLRGNWTFFFYTFHCVNYIIQKGKLGDVKMKPIWRFWMMELKWLKIICVSGETTTILMHQPTDSFHNELLGFPLEPLWCPNRE